MAHAMDITVLEQGDAANRGISGNGVDAPSDTDLAPLIDWLNEFEQDNERKFVIDSAYRLWSEYEKLGSDNFVLKLLQTKYDRKQYQVQEPHYHRGGELVVPKAFAEGALPLRLVLAVTLTDRGGISVVNATEPDWIRNEEALECESVSVEHLLDDWLRSFVRRQDAPGPQPGDHKYHLPPENLEGALADARPIGTGTNNRKAWQKDDLRYEFDRQHGTLEVYRISDGQWLREVDIRGNVTKSEGDKGRRGSGR